ncbi:sigma-54 interaction domain-containing protein [Paramaledivibacter caminithermalis]|jgi:transcriptional regulator with PAS, ATPase and Fis domain|uniref:Transcriptional regulator containing PAS, AAA-type ATPase, and DNA-binding Fis domains n=1 Tax=Paramaledivibacter caminithermalis (strain DSM 15212 / CIP 107654 / DViRD3) TaxID=1121301 RepID=A0A1M6RGA6_PARC5|nr:sigma 54-interacting transcriptional regulator [Paramaledivibacter caminithermalis]SHK31499.1 Transcriptional regulator containing PAS, AAA-type ATPase, and DNA-binding Fis domains [Paramaledivibacter caminithermalis DSM 15212]
MKKTLAIISYSLETVKIYYEQIKSLFADNVDVIKFCVDDEEIKRGITADIVLIPSYNALNKIRKYIKNRAEIIFVNRTISKSGFDKIMSIPKGTEVMLLDESLEMSKQMISVLYQIGIRHIDLIPGSIQERIDIKNRILIVLGQSKNIPNEANKVINIGSSLIDINTIIDLGIKLKLDHILNRQNIKKSYKEIITANVGLSEILIKTNRFESQLDILLQVIDDGVIAINSKGLIFSYNESAKRILGFRNEEVIDRDGIKLFPQIPFEYALRKIKSVKERLVKINGDDVVVSVDTITHSGKIYGAVAIIRRFSEAERKQHKLRAQLIGKGHKAKYKFDDIIGESEEIRKCKDIARRMSKSNSSILITGESGTGKELFAHAMHNSSKRRDYQFVAVNCGALPESLLESELFGYEEGAFTGARRGGKPGLFELAHRGTLFLDEIGEMPLKLQMRLLRVLQEREVMRIGGDRLINVDIRLIAATNRDLKKMVKKGEFREDLYYRLNVLPLKIPPLRKRLQDIFPLINQIKKEFNSDFKFTEKAKQALITHNWRGNVRELRNYIEYLVNLNIKEVDIDDLPIELEVSLKDEVFDREEKRLTEKFIDSIGKNIKKYIFVLEELDKSFVEKKRIGRRSICLKAKERGIFVSEQEVRNILINLEKFLMVEIFRGRSGTVITEYGRRVLRYIQKG